MTPLKPLRALTALAAVSGALAIAPGPAAAADPPTFCVNAPACPAGGFTVGLGAALSMASAGAGHADILLGPSPDGKPYVGPFAYAGSTGSNSVSIKGQGRPVLTSATAGKPVLSLLGPAVNRVSGVALQVPALPGADGLRLDRATAEDVVITGGGSSSLNRGAALSGEAQLRDAKIDMKSGFGIELFDGPSTIDASTVKAPFGVIGGASDLRLDDTRVIAEHKALQMIGSSGGNGNTVPDGLMIVGSELTTSAADGEAIFVRDTPTRIVRTTVASRSAAPQAGRTALTFEALSRNADLSVQTSVLGGYPRALKRSAAAGRLAPLTVRDSEWSSGNDADGGDAAGPRSYAGLVQAAPRFVARLAGDLRLRGGDGAIDLNGNPLGADAFNTGNLDDAPLTDGDGDGKAVSDAGAHEYRRAAPAIVSLQAAAPKFTAKATDADGDAVELAWNFGDGSPLVKGGAVSHVLAPGQHAITLTARDEAGVTTTKTFGVTIAAPPADAPPTDPPPADAPPADLPSVPGTDVPGTDVPGTDAPGTVPVAPSGGSGPAADRTAPLVRGARVKRRRGRTAKLTLDVTEAATLRITVGRRTRTITVNAGRSARVLKALPRRRAKLRIVATDAAGNRSAAKVLKLRRR